MTDMASASMPATIVRVRCGECEADHEDDVREFMYRCWA